MSEKQLSDLLQSMFMKDLSSTLRLNAQRPIQDPIIEGMPAEPQTEKEEVAMVAFLEHEISKAKYEKINSGVYDGIYNYAERKIHFLERKLPLLKERIALRSVISAPSNPTAKKTGGRL
jgi:hypothetical protein